MKEFLASLDWMTLLSAIWTVVLVPIGTQIYKYLKSKKLDKYADILYREVKNAVKSVYETEVKDIKGTEDWTPEKQEEIKIKSAIIFRFESFYEKQKSNKQI